MIPPDQLWAPQGVIQMTEQDDKRLVADTLAGQLTAFDRLVEKYQKPVFNLALRMVLDPDDALDVAQGAFVKAYERLHSYKPAFKFFSWLYRIVINEALNFLRQRKGLVEVTQDIPSEEPDPAEASDTTQKVLEALQALPDEQRAVVTLKHLEGFSYSEIAVMLRIPEKKVKSRLYEGRQALKEVLMQKGMMNS
jgi:RNA polymerase sigma-70 factor, ECF subfamily